MSRFSTPETIIRVGTCSIVKSKNPQISYLITCAHNVVYKNKDQIINLSTGGAFNQNMKIFIDEDKEI